jgi:hypothetical protein
MLPIPLKLPRVRLINKVFIDELGFGFRECLGIQHKNVNKRNCTRVFTDRIDLAISTSHRVFAQNTTRIGCSIISRLFSMLTVALLAFFAHRSKQSYINIIDESVIGIWATSRYARKTAIGPQTIIRPFVNFLSKPFVNI